MRRGPAPTKNREKTNQEPAPFWAQAPVRLQTKPCVRTVPVRSPLPGQNRPGVLRYPMVSSSACHRAQAASEGIRQSPRGDRATDPTLGPSGTQLRLTCWVKNRR